MSTKTRVARVIPLIRLAPSVALLDYALPALHTLQVGDIVRVPFRSTSVRGVVWEILSAEERTRPLKSVSSQTSEYLTAEQLAIARWMQAETCTPLMSSRDRSCQQSKAREENVFVRERCRQRSRLHLLSKAENAL